MWWFESFVRVLGHRATFVAILLLQGALAGLKLSKVIRCRWLLTLLPIIIFAAIWIFIILYAIIKAEPGY